MMDPSSRDAVLSQKLNALRFLVADSSSSRKSFRQLLSDFGVKPSQIGTTGTFAESAEYIRANRPNVIIADNSMEQGSALELLAIQKEVVPSDEPRVFFLATARDSDALVSGAADESADAVLVKPFTFAIIRESFHEVLNDRLNPTPYAKAIQDGKAQLQQGKLEVAAALFERARAMDPASPQAYAYLGSALAGLQRWDQALQSYEHALERAPSHFRSLTGLLECHIRKGEHAKAYEVGKRVASEHTVPMKYIPELIRISVLNKKFDDLLEFYKVSDGIPKMEPSIGDPLAAGLVVCGLHFLQQKNQSSAMDAFRKAEAAAPNNLKIKKRILQAFIAHDLEEETRLYYSRLPEEVRDSVDIRLALFETLDRKGEPSHVVAEGLRLLKEGIRAKVVYAAVIKRSIELKRQESVIEELIHSAIQDCPEDREFFIQLRKD